MKRIHIIESKLRLILDEGYGRPLNILIGCEESQAICAEFRRNGQNAYSCDLQRCSGGHPEWHFNCDVFDIIDNKGGVTQAGNEVHVDKWDLLIAHPPCTYLTTSGNRWFRNPDGSRNEARYKALEDGAAFFMKLANANVDHIAIENPVGVMSTRWRKPDQIFQPWQFGDIAKKKTCLWLKNLPKLNPTVFTEPKGLDYSMKGGSYSMSKFIQDSLTKAAQETSEWIVNNGIDIKTEEGRLAKKAYLDNARRRFRSKTFKGVAREIVRQYIEYLNNLEETI